MYINNLTGKAIRDISFEGFMFSIPAGVSLAWKPFGQFILKNLYPAKQGEGGGVPPVVEAKASQWKGDRYVEVVRFKLNAALIPKRADLLKIAKQRGVDAETIESWKEDESFDNEEISRAINELEVPDHIRFPEAPAGGEVSDTDEVADAVINDVQTTDDTKVDDEEKGPEAGDPVIPAAPVKAAPKTGAKKTASAKQAAKAATSTPRTKKPGGTK